MWHYPELKMMFIYIKNNMSFEQFRMLIHNIIRLYKNGCALQNVSSIKNSFLSSIEKVIPVLLTELYGSVVATEIINYVKEDCEYDLEEIFGLIDGHSKLISKDSAIALWKLEEMFPHDEMFQYFNKITSGE